MSIKNQSKKQFPSTQKPTGMAEGQWGVVAGLLPVGVCALNADGQLQYHNPLASHYLGLSETDLGSLFSVVCRRIDSSGSDRFTAGLSELLAVINLAMSGTQQTIYLEGRTTEGRQRLRVRVTPGADKYPGVIMVIEDVTEQTEEQGKMAALSANIGEGLIFVDLDGTITRSNQEWLQLFQIAEPVEGLSVKQVMASTPSVAYDQDIGQILAQILEGKRCDVYVHLKRLDRHLQVSITPILDDGELQSFLATARDITVLIEKTVEANEMAKKAGRHLRELTELAELSNIVGFQEDQTYHKYVTKTSTLLQSPGVAIYLYRPTTQQLGRVGASEAVRLPRHVALTEESPLSKSFLSTKPVGWYVEVGNGAGNYLAVPIAVSSKTLGVLVVSGRVKPYAEHDTRLLRLVAARLGVLVENTNLYQDVNARRERWEAVFQFTDEGIIIFDRHGRIVGFNPACESLTRYPLAEALGQPFGKIIRAMAGESESTGAMTAVRRVLGAGETITKSEQLIATKGGDHIWTEISYSPVFDSSGKVTSGIAILRNAQRDREIEEIKSDFISIVSHELRTPLTAIKGFLSMIIQKDFGELNDKQFHFLGRVYQSNQRMINLVEDVLDVSSIESGKIRLNANPLALEGVMADVVSELSSKGFERQILIRQTRRKRLPLVLADEARIRQVLTNLVDNAIKYSLPGSEVRIGFRVTGDMLVTTIADQGVGISPANFERLFTKFGRVYNPMSLQSGGTGLGLYIVKNLVESHGGSIWVTSREGKGSKFSFSLPLARQLPLLNSP
jgi:PAS domain S-box-containing protein